MFTIFNKQNEKGETALILLCKNNYNDGHYENIKRLLEIDSSSINLIDDDGNNALMSTITAKSNNYSYNNSKTISLLISYMEKSNKRDSEDKEHQSN